MTDDTVKTFGSLALVLITVVLVLNAFFGASMSASGVVDEPTTVEMVGGSGTVADSMRVLAINSSTTSLEDGVKLNGQSDSKVAGQVDANVQGSWSFCSWAAAEPSVVNNSERRSIAGYNDVALSYNGSSDQYEAYYYNQTSRDSYVSTVPATSPTDDTLVCAVHDGGELTTYRNTTAGQSVSTTGDNVAPAPPADNWNGTLEETRLWDYALSSNQLDEFHTEPVLAIDGEAPAARLAYDVHDRGDGQIPVHFASGSASLSNGSFVDGFEAVNASVGTDFAMTGLLNNTVSPTGTGVVDGDGTVLFVTFTGEGGPILTALSSMVNGAFGLLSLGLIVLAAGYLLRSFNEF